jgi:hypothetical protein
MHHIEFEIMEEVKTGKVFSGFWGDKAEIVKRWTPKTAEIICGGGDIGSIMIKFDSTHWGYVDLYTNTPNENGVLEMAFTESGDDDWHDIKNVKIY